MPTVQLDNIAAAKTMAEHLISLGHTNIGVISGPENSTITNDRLRGFKAALDGAGLKYNPANRMYGDYSIPSGAMATIELLELDNPPTAIFCMNDEMAIGAIRQVKKMGLRVPEDVSITGFDDINFAEFCDPSITTIAQPAEEFGTNAMLMLVELLNGNKPKNKDVYLPFELVIRDSTGRSK